MNVSFTPKAEADLDAIASQISKDDPNMAKYIIARILQAITMLERFPLLGRIGRVSETRELSIARLPYYAVYHFADDTEIEVIAIMHERQNFP